MGKTENLTFAECFYSWQKWRKDRRKVAPGTIDRTEDDFGRFLYGTKFSRLRIDQIRQEDLWDFFDSVFAADRISQSAFLNLKSLINGVVDHAARSCEVFNSRQASRDYIVPSGRLVVRNRRMTRREVRRNVFMPDEVALITDFLSRSRNLIDQGLLLMFWTGLRVGELCVLRPDDLEDDVLLVRRMERRHKVQGSYVYTVENMTKANAGEREVVLIEDAQRLFLKISKGKSGYVFTRRGVRIRGLYFTRRLHRVCEILGLDSKSCHAVRKTYASTLLNAGVPVAEVQALLGHISAQTTLSYYYYNNASIETQKRALDRALKG